MRVAGLKATKDFPSVSFEVCQNPLINLSQRKQAIYRLMCFCTLFNGRDAGTRRLSRNARQHPRYAWLNSLRGPWNGLLVTRPSNTLALLPSDATPLIPTRLRRLPAQSWPYVFAANRCYFNAPAASETLPFRRCSFVERSLSGRRSQEVRRDREGGADRKLKGSLLRHVVLFFHHRSYYAEQPATISAAS